MIIWSGMGWLGYIIIAGVMAITEVLAESLWGRRSSDKHPWIFIFSWAITSIVCWFVGRWFNRDCPAKVLGFKSFDSFNWGGKFDGHTTAGVRLEYAGLILGSMLYLFYAFVLFVLPKP